MPKPIIFWGAKGHAKVLRDFIGALDYELICTFDNDSGVQAPFPDVPLLYGEQAFQEWMRDRQEVYCLVAIGGARGEDRCRLQALMKSLGALPAIVAHPSAVIAGSAVLGDGSQILAQAIVSAESRIGEATIINHKASVDHECTIGNGVHVGPGATLAGCVSVRDFSFVGTGATILPRLKIGRNVVIGAGAVVTRDLPDDVVAYGNPARIMRRNS